MVRGGAEVLSNVIASQIRTHAPYGGVVPELASREHLQNIVPVVRTALQQAECSLEDLDAIAVTEGPGLAGALLVGVMYAKGLAFALNKPLIAVNHLEGHIHAVLLEAKKAATNAGATRRWRWWSPAATRICIWQKKLRAPGAIKMSAEPWMTPPAKPSTKFPNCSGLAILAVPGLTGWRSMETRMPFLSAPSR